MKDIFAESEREDTIDKAEFAAHPGDNRSVESMFAQLLLRKAQHIAGDSDDMDARLAQVRALERHLDANTLPQRVEMFGYLRMLHEDMSALFSGRKISLLVRSDRGSLSPQTAARIGLLIFELCLNSIQHAFTQRSGVIQIRYRSRGKIWQVSVTDDGDGFRRRSRLIFCIPIADILTGMMHAHIKRKSNAFGTEICVSGRVDH